jgi:hypothetical protein
MKKNKNIDVKGISITVNKRGADEFICITDIAKNKNPNLIIQWYFYYASNF